MLGKSDPTQAETGALGEDLPRWSQPWLRVETPDVLVAVRDGHGVQERQVAGGERLNGEIALLGRLHGVPTPLNELLQHLANTFARERRAAGSMPVGELVRLAGEAVAAVGGSPGSDH